MTSPLRRHARTRPRRGMAIPLVLGFLVVAALLAVAVHTATRAERGFSLHARHSEIAWQVALSAGRAAAFRYGERLGDPNDPLHLKFVAATGDAFPLPDLAPADDPDLAALVRDLPRTSVELRGELAGIEALSPAGDPVERRGLLRVEARVKHRGASRRVFLERAFRFAAGIPPVVSRFTLFVKNSPGERLNALANDANGLPVNGRPLLLHNGDGATPSENGWIFLGGPRTCLHLARGMENTGEDFHLPDAITRSPFFPDQNYLLLHLNVGFHADAGADPVFARFPAKDAFRGSLLRLYGCPAAGAVPTPALVFGDVWRRYLQAAAVGPTVGGKIAGVTPLPWIVRPADAARGPNVPPFLFLSPKLYQVYMSQVREEPYNRSLDFLLDPGSRATSPPPLLAKRFAPPGVADPYPAADPAIAFENPRGDTVYEGKLSAFDLGKFAEGRAARIYDSVADLLADVPPGEEGRPPRLRGITLVRGDDVDLARPGGIDLAGTGTLVFEKSVKISALRAEDPSADRLAVVSLAGDIVCGSGTVEAGLVALNGKVILEGTGVRGFVAAGTLDPDRMRRGGRIAWDARLCASAGPGAKTTVSPYTFAAGERLLLCREAKLP